MKQWYVQTVSIHVQVANPGIVYVNLHSDNFVSAFVVRC